MGGRSRGRCDAKTATHKIWEGDGAYIDRPRSCYYAWPHMAASKSRLTQCSVSITHFLNIPFLPSVWMLIGPIQQLLIFCFFYPPDSRRPAWLASLKDFCESEAAAGYCRSGGDGPEGGGGGREGDGNGSGGAQMHISGRVLDLVTCLTPSINHLGRPLLFKKAKQNDTFINAKYEDHHQEIFFSYCPLLKWIMTFLM